MKFEQLTPAAPGQQRSRYTYSALARINMPVLIVNGAHDKMDPPSNSLVMVQHMPNAKMILYPDAGHGSLFQYSEGFTQQANSFLK